MSTQTPGGLGPPNVYRRFFNSAGEVLLKREPTGSLGVRGYPGGVFASFCRYELKLGQKEVAAHSMFFLEGLRSLCADNPPYPSFSGLACGPPSFFARRKKAKTCQGASPPGPPGGLPAFFGGKPAVARLPESTIKKGCGPGVWGWLHFFGPAPPPTPGASGPPCCMDVGSRKPAKSPGVWGQSPRRLFASFLHAEKGCGRAGQTHSINYDFFMRLCHKTQSVLWHPLSLHNGPG